jgi:glycosyltransferase involved in cell wall biosynthesis
VRAALARWRAEEDSYLLLVGPFDPRHNHALVLTAFGLFRARDPRSDWRLVFALPSPNGADALRTFVQRLGLEAAVDVLDGVSDADQLALITAARAVLVASLSDTTGESVLQAMALGRPVLCSAIADLTDLTADAALTFDNHRPADLLTALQLLDSEPGIADRLRRMGPARIAELEEPARVAQRYGNMLREASCPASSR